MERPARNLKYILFTATVLSAGVLLYFPIAGGLQPVDVFSSRQFDKQQEINIDASTWDRLWLNDPATNHP